MIWAETPREFITSQVRNAVLPVAERSFHADADSGVHSAAELLVARWAGDEAVERIEEELRTHPEGPAGARWMLGPNGHTFAVVRGPLAFRMGSPDHEQGRYENEQTHYRRIDRSLAVATKEVTVAQYRAFDPKRLPLSRYSPEPACPMNDVDWFAAARYCNWLSKQGRIPTDQLCYPEPIEQGMLLPANTVDLIGYRLPTEAEWEYLCRAGALTARPFAESEELLPRYGWTWLNSEDRTWAVGRRLPNPLGLFDMLGNLWEWCQDGITDQGPDSTPPYPGGTSLEGPASDAVAGGVISRSAHRILRGGAFDYSPGFARSASRYQGAPGYHEGPYGFRVVRTLPPEAK
jgi:formylglycine-generating enzyme required for sulfatase activity